MAGLPFLKCTNSIFRYTTLVGYCKGWNSPVLNMMNNWTTIWGTDSANASKKPSNWPSFCIPKIIFLFSGRVVSISNSPINRLEFLKCLDIQWIEVGKVLVTAWKCINANPSVLAVHNKYKSCAFIKAWKSKTVEWIFFILTALLRTILSFTTVWEYWRNWWNTCTLKKCWVFVTWTESRYDTVTAVNGYSDRCYIFWPAPNTGQNIHF